MIKVMKETEFIRNFCTTSKGTVDFFLGAGASVSSGIPTSKDLVWYFKREIFCTENNINKDMFKDLNAECNRRILQEYFDSQQGYPNEGDKNEYSFYFEKCFSLPSARKDFIDNQVSNRNPSTGYLCLASLVLNKIINNIWTTNFDGLTEAAIYKISSSFAMNVLSSANSNSFKIINYEHPCIYKLHGDYRYDKLQNTSDELKEMEDKLEEQMYEKLQNKGLLVIGYSGSDDSIMSFFEKNISKNNFLSKGLYWATIKGSKVSNRVTNLIENLNKNGIQAYIIEIDNFETFLFNIYDAIGITVELIEKQMLLKDNERELKFNLEKEAQFIKLNTFESISYPKCSAFKTDINNWSTLKQCRGNLISSLFKGYIYSFADEKQIIERFGTHVKSEIIIQEIPNELLYRNDSVYVGMLYDLIGKNLEERGLTRYRKSKFYLEESVKIENNYKYYEAIDISLSFINKKYYLNLSPTFHVTYSNGKELGKYEYQKLINYKSNVYNKDYNEIFLKWQKILVSHKKMVFEYNGFSIEFNTPALSCGGDKREDEWPTIDAYHTDEPLMLFSNDDKNKCSINQLKGLIKYGPIDCSFIHGEPIYQQLKLAIISPSNSIDKLLSHLNSLNTSVSNSSNDSFLPHFEGFNKIYKKALIVPPKDDNNLCKIHDHNLVQSYNTQQFVNFLKNEITSFAMKRTDFDVLVIYIPKTYSKFRISNNKLDDFNLHDAIKLYATDKNVTVQFIEEKSLSSQNKCKVLWGLSTAIYAKSSMGVLWHPHSIVDGTAYIGISYAISKEKQICIGCSQLFDSTGTGMRMLLKKIDAPRYAGKNNPYMGKEEACSMMNSLKTEYYRCNPTAKLNRIVIHKTTPFMKDEILGILQAFEGMEDIELIQIQQFNHWKGIKFGNNHKEINLYPVNRGTVMQLSNDTFLLWTHGCIFHKDLGAGNYYKNGRGTPTPLVIKRYYGKCSGDILAKEILMLTKMNWNSGDSLYKVLPVTLDFAKIISRMSKQKEALYNKAYDFRYFM